MKKVVKALVVIYKKTLSPLIGRDCIFTPTCSVYMLNAVQKYGLFVGFFMGIWRILRCNPFGKGGFDPVKENIYYGQAKWLL